MITFKVKNIKHVTTKEYHTLLADNRMQTKVDVECKWNPHPMLKIIAALMLLYSSPVHHFTCVFIHIGTKDSYYRILRPRVPF